jgi:BirA family biotin operon repressor/biotin-[acetyl-CoA-carboxylase] ligase
LDSKERILHFLKSAEGFVSGEILSRDLKFSRSAVWKNIQELRRLGYAIDAVPRRGYCLQAVPDKPYAWEINGQWESDRKIGQQVIYREEVSSTMDEAFRLGVDGASEGTVIIAERQTQGRGRLGRMWVSPAEQGIYLSWILRPALLPAQTPKLTLLTAVAVCETLSAICGGVVRIKWPNDVLIRGRKVAGILTELHAEVDRVKFVVIGLGINVHIPVEGLPAGATSVGLETNQPVGRAPIIRDFLERFERWYQVALAEGFSSVLKRWKDLSATLGYPIRISDRGGWVEGEAVDLAEDGGLLIRDHQGRVLKKMSGDVMHLPSQEEKVGGQ